MLRLIRPGSLLVGRAMSTRPGHPLSPAFLQSSSFRDRTALICDTFRYSYSQLLDASARIAATISELLSIPMCIESDTILDKVCSQWNVQQRYGNQPRIAILCDNNATYVSTLWAIWRLGCIAVPLCKVYPNEELHYVMTDSDCSLIVSSTEFATTAKSLSQQCNVKHLTIPAPKPGELNGTELVQQEEWSKVDWGKMGALIVYTSGTTGRPKGVLHTHRNLSAQISMLLEAWEWTCDDAILHVLPLHHLHGILNALLSPLSCGATVIMEKRFDAGKVWRVLLNEEKGHPPVSVFTGVPTMYARLLQSYDKANHSVARKEHIWTYCKNNVRLLMSGSAALPEPIFHRWREISGHFLLERYGMTEFGMSLSNPLNGERIPGSVGSPLATVEVTILSSDKDTDADGHSGELLVKGPAVFEGYWGKPRVTAESFTEDGWFRTGDITHCIDGVYKILGRSSVDIIKSGGYKISALEIERVLMEHPDVNDCAVVGVPSEMWGETITAVIASPTPEKFTIEAVQLWCKGRLAHYKLPRIVKALFNLPRNVMGKVNKVELKKDLL